MGVGQKKFPNHAEQGEDGQDKTIQGEGEDLILQPCPALLPSLYEMIKLRQVWELIHIDNNRTTTSKWSMQGRCNQIRESMVHTKHFFFFFFRKNLFGTNSNCIISPTAKEYIKPIKLQAIMRCNMQFVSYWSKTKYSWKSKIYLIPSRRSNPYEKESNFWRIFKSNLLIIKIMKVWRKEFWLWFLKGWLNFYR